MFELNPATRRVGERAAIDDLGTPVVVVDGGGRIVTLNDAAETLLGSEKRAAFARPLSEFLDGESVDVGADGQRVSLRTDGRIRTFDVTTSPLSVEAGGPVGHTVVFYDLTDELRREQRLDVLNRVLRHNLRNDMGVVTAYADAAKEEVDDEEVAALLATVDEKASDLLDLGEKARDVERILSTELSPEAVDVGATLSAVVDAVAESNPGTSVTLQCADGVTVTTDPRAFRVACENLVENAAEHGGDEPTVVVHVETTDEAVRIGVEDDVPGIPDHELATLDAGEETPLQHGSGLGLWVVHWLAERVGGTVGFETNEAGTVATLSLPR